MEEKMTNTLSPIIEKNIPLPERRNSLMATIKLMQDGDSILVSINSYQAARYCFKKLNINFVGKSVNKTEYRIWRCGEHNKNSIPIEKNIPLPNNASDIIGQMEVGDSILVSPRKAESMRKTFVRMGFKMKQKYEDDSNVRLWRTE